MALSSPLRPPFSRSCRENTSGPGWIWNEPRDVAETPTKEKRMNTYKNRLQTPVSGPFCANRVNIHLSFLSYLFFSPLFILAPFLFISLSFLFYSFSLLCFHRSSSSISRYFFLFLSFWLRLSSLLLFLPFAVCFLPSSIFYPIQYNQPFIGCCITWGIENVKKHE